MPNKMNITTKTCFKPITYQQFIINMALLCLVHPLALCKIKPIKMRNFINKNLTKLC